MRYVNFEKMKKEQKIKNLILGTIMLCGIPIFQGMKDWPCFEYICILMGGIIIAITIINKRIIKGDLIEMSLMEINDNKQTRKIHKRLEGKELEIVLDIILRNNKAFFWPFGRAINSKKALLIRISTGERILCLDLHIDNEGHLKIMNSNYWVSLEADDYNMLRSILL